MDQIPQTAVLDTGEPPPDEAATGGHPVVLLHGWTGSKEDFAAIVPALAAGRRVIAPDLPGHGGSGPARDGDYSLGAHVAFLHDLLEALAVGDVHLVGHSHGGLLAQRVAEAMAHRITSLTLIGAGLGALGDVSREMVVRVATAARHHGMAAAWAAVQGRPAPGIAPPHAEQDGQDPGDPREAFVRERFLAMPPEAVTGVARNLLIARPLGAFLRGVDFPVLVCHGEGDTTWLPAEQQLLARRIAGAAYRVIPDALHSPAAENPDGLLAELLPFLAAADPAPRPPHADAHPPTC